MNEEKTEILSSYAICVSCSLCKGFWVGSGMWWAPKCDHWNTKSETTKWGPNPETCPSQLEHAALSDRRHFKLSNAQEKAAFLNAIGPERRVKVKDSGNSGLNIFFEEKEVCAGNMRKAMEWFNKMAANQRGFGASAGVKIGVDGKFEPSRADLALERWIDEHVLDIEDGLRRNRSRYP